MSTALLLARGSEQRPPRQSVRDQPWNLRRGGTTDACSATTVNPPRNRRRPRTEQKKELPLATPLIGSLSLGPEYRFDVQVRRHAQMGVDFAHMFNTDVRLLRFLAPLPEARKTLRMKGALRSTLPARSPGLSLGGV